MKVFIKLSGTSARSATRVLPPAMRLVPAGSWHPTTPHQRPFFGSRSLSLPVTLPPALSRALLLAQSLSHKQQCLISLTQATLPHLFSQAAVPHLSHTSSNASSLSHTQQCLISLTHKQQGLISLTQAAVPHLSHKQQCLISHTKATRPHLFSQATLPSYL